ncbi:MAG: helix-turn-helix transcriptional regulator [Acidimicrobiales bacterium]
MTRRLTPERLVGRTAEIEALRRVRADASAGTPTVALIGGEAGVGKTRVLQETAAEAEGDGFVSIIGRCLDLGADVLPLAPFIDIVRGLANRFGQDGLAELIGPGGHELYGLAALTPGEDLSSQETPTPARLHQQMLNLVEALARRQPLLLGVEDLHWADGSSRALLAFLARHLRAGRFLLLLTFRTDELHRRHPLLPWLAELERAQRPERLDIAPFDRDELGRLATALAGESLDPVVADRVFLQSHGNAFIAEELISAALSGVAGIPATLHEAVGARLHELPDGHVRLLRHAAASTHATTADVLAEVCDLPEPEVEDGLRGLVERGVLVATDRGLGFRHALVQEVVYASLLPGELVRVHRAYAEVLERRPSPPAGELAYHWHRAGDDRRALAASMTAGAEAVSMAAMAEAQAHYTRALELWESQPAARALTGMTHGELVEAVADAAYYAGDFRNAISILRAELERYEAHEVGRLGLLERLAKHLWMIQDAEFLAVAEEAATTAADAASDDRVRILALHARMLGLAGDYRRAEQVAGELAVRGEVPALTDDELSARNTWSWARAAQGRADGVDELRDVLRIADASGRFDEAVRARLNLTHWLARRGGPAEAAALCAGGIADVDRRGAGLTLGTMFWGNRVYAQYRLGLWNEALAEARRAQLDAGAMGLSLALAENWAQILVGQGRLDETPFLLDAWMAARGEGMFLALTPAAVAAARAAMIAARWDDAFRIVDETLVSVENRCPPEVPELVAAGVAAEVERLLADRPRQSTKQAHPLDRADAMLQGLGPVRDDPTIDDRHLCAEIELWSLQAIAERARITGADAEEWLDLAARWPDLYRLDQSAYCNCRAAEALLGRRRDPAARVRASTALLAAADVAASLGAAPLRDLAEAVARRARLTLELASRSEPPAAEARQASTLSNREVDVLALVAQGLTNQEIADRLFISVKTAGTHVSHILVKLGARNRGGAASIGRDLGLID